MKATSVTNLTLSFSLSLGFALLLSVYVSSSMAKETKTTDRAPNSYVELGSSKLKSGSLTIERSQTSHGGSVYIKMIDAETGAVCYGIEKGTELSISCLKSK